MRVRRRISRVRLGQAYVTPWPPLEVVSGSPPSESVAVLGTTFPNFYRTLGASYDGLYNSFFNHVISWIVGPERPVLGFGAANAIPDLTITAGSNLGPIVFPEPFTLGIFGAPGWELISAAPAAVTVGDRGFFANNERKLPNQDIRFRPDESAGSFQYRIGASYQYKGANVDITSAQVGLQYIFEFRPYQAILAGNTMYAPCVHSYKWAYQDDGGFSEGGYVSHFSEIPFGGVLGGGNIETLMRLSDRTYGSTLHMAHGFSAFEFSTPYANDPGGILLTSTLCDTTDNEVGGATRAGHVWIQPASTGTDYHAYNGASGNLFDPAEGYRLVPTLPLTMN